MPLSHLHDAAYLTWLNTCSLSMMPHFLAGGLQSKVLTVSLLKASEHTCNDQTSASALFAGLSTGSSEVARVLLPHAPAGEFGVCRPHSAGSSCYWPSCVFSSALSSPV